jgi:hypothetical protein
MSGSSPEKPYQQGHQNGNDEAGHDWKVEAEAFPDDVDIPWQAPKWQLAQPRPGKACRSHYGSENN